MSVCAIDVVGVVFGSILVFVGLPEDSEAERFRREYPAAAARLRERWSRVNGTCTITERPSDRPRQIDLFVRARFWADHGCRKMEIDRRVGGVDGRPIRSLVACLAGDRSFQLDRLPGADQFYEVAAVADPERVAQTYYNSLGLYLDCLEVVLIRSLEAYQTLPGYRLDAADTFVAAGRELVRLKFSTGTSARRNTYVVVLDPGWGWVIREYEFWPGGLPGARASVVVDYDASDPAAVVPKRVVYRNIDGSQSECLFESIQDTPTPASAFTMAHYGLPDLASGGPKEGVGPAFLEPAARGRPVGWLGGLSVVGLALAFWLHRRARC